MCWQMAPAVSKTSSQTTSPTRRWLGGAMARMAIAICASATDAADNTVATCVTLCFIHAADCDAPCRVLVRVCQRGGNWQIFFVLFFLLHPAKQLWHIEAVNLILSQKFSSLLPDFRAVCYSIISLSLSIAISPPLHYTVFLILPLTDCSCETAWKKMSKRMGCPKIHFRAERSPAFFPIFAFPPPAIFLLRCSHTGLGLNKKCIVSFIHSSQRVIELICLASVCPGAAKIRASVDRDGIAALKDGIKMSPRL